ncbi:type I-B CRISPR-associated endonuclease Cas1b [Microscilla marina]|uniref:CRISPR-associated endonuclease Cas1 n=1 Tax=Microscilla marina ATCC 23134 TaxID=313606 RepID=A1ZVP6_MICM2|nr:type I-B CRISPR-associated endonuclease Cas1b [Microscilla marina]EAY25589.1 crispr-associated protein Cas1 [Microscilla marina ATCC 23134]
MPKTYYLFNPGRLSKNNRSLKFTPVDAEGNAKKPTYLPINDINELCVLGSLDANSALYNFLGQQKIPVHFFDYYEHYTGSFMPKDYLLAGKVHIAQTQAYTQPAQRLVIARKLLEGGIYNMLKNLGYYQNRGKEVTVYGSKIKQYYETIRQAQEMPIAELMGLEGNVRQVYYQAFDTIINDFAMQGRSRQPPLNEVNALISFGNSFCYNLCVGQIYHTQLDPTISFLHEPGARRYSLALDIAEVFKPVLVDRLIFALLNKKQIQAKHFDKKLNACYLNESGGKIYLKAWDERLKETIKHRAMNKNVSYRRLVRMECYKLVKHVLGIDEYSPFKMRW